LAQDNPIVRIKGLLSAEGKTFVATTGLLKAVPITGAVFRAPPLALRETTDMTSEALPREADSTLALIEETPPVVPPIAVTEVPQRGEVVILSAEIHVPLPARAEIAEALAPVRAVLGIPEAARGLSNGFDGVTMTVP